MYELPQEEVVGARDVAVAPEQQKVRRAGRRGEREPPGVRQPRALPAESITPRVTLDTMHDWQRPTIVCARTCCPGRASRDGRTRW
eukprot:COSAG05_NODE_3692_length_1902_cov_2.459235_2_plen_86_part_00